jgi:hypothetical protein
VTITAHLTVQKRMENMSWYLDAALVSEAHVFCAGTLAQCVRKWTRLSDKDRDTAFIKIGSEVLGFRTIAASEIGDYARSPELMKA